MIIFRSWGAVPLLAIMGCLAVVGGVCDAILFPREDDYSFVHAWPIALALVLAGIITLLADRFRAAKLYEDGHLFFIRPKTWAFMSFGAAALYMLIHYT